MSRATQPSSSSSSTTLHKHKRRKVARATLLECLEILGPLAAPFPPELPSPPASRSSSPIPATGHKRRRESTNEQSHSKRPRISAPSEAASTSRLPPVPPFPQARALPTQANTSLRSEPSEDGEVSEEVPAYRASLLAANNVPVRRPRRGTRLPTNYYDDLYAKYHGYGRMLKYSGQERLLSTHPSSHPRYKPLQVPPAPGTPYHKYGHLIARLEHLDALLCFTYAIWVKDYSKKICQRLNWLSIYSFLEHCKGVWSLEDTDDREKAFVGLIFMIEGFIQARKLRYAAPLLNSEDERLMKRLQIQADAEAEREAKAARVAAEGSKPSTSTSMLPSPASSEGSTPPSKEGTPHAAGAATALPPTASSGARPHPPPAPEQTLPGPHITVPVSANIVAPRRSQSGGLMSSSGSLEKSQRLLTLPVLANHFPRTWARMMFTSLAVTDEHEPDIEDEEGELFWPGQALTGEGLGWVCAMGKAMIKEFGKAYGYRGVESVIPRDDEDAEGAAAASGQATSPPEVGSVQR